MINRKAIIILMSIALLSFVFFEPVALVAEPSYSASNDDWPMFQHDPEHTGVSTESAPLSMPVVAWDIEPQDSLGIAMPYGASVIADGVVYLSGSTNLLALNASTGETIWKVHADSSSYLVVSDGVLYASTYA
jgi:outer membrane protein assembly factor BamB